MPAGRANTGGVVKVKEHGRASGCPCCVPFRLKENGRRTRQRVRRVTRLELHMLKKELSR
jgi:hypothetical protein